jgi:hypothetical protein
LTNRQKKRMITCQTFLSCKTMVSKWFLLPHRCIYSRLFLKPRRTQAHGRQMTSALAPGGQTMIPALSAAVNAVEKSPIVLRAQRKAVSTHTLSPIPTASYLKSDVLSWPPAVPPLARHPSSLPGLRGTAGKSLSAVSAGHIWAGCFPRKIWTLFTV